MPYFALDSNFYNISRKYYQSDHDKEVDLKCIELYHPLHRLKKKINRMPEKESITISQISDNINSHHHQIKVEYHIIKELFILLSQIAIKWKIANFSNIYYRFASRTGHMKVLDIEELGRNYFTLESVWLAIEAENLPKGLGVTEETIQYAHIYQASVSRLINFFIGLNNRDFNVLSSIDQFANEKKKNVNFNAYHTFEVPGAMWRCLNKAPKNLENERLKELIAEMDFACRAFEEKLYESLLEYTHFALTKAL